jgi:eukaryotic-like serine/threonine-protein kinase
MPDDPCVQQLLDELLDRQATPEEVCGTCVELLPVVRERWRQICRARAEFDALLPAGPYGSLRAWPQGDGSLPTVPGYDVEEVLGRGGMGVVFRARHLRLNRPVALKMLLAGPYAGPRERERFRREAEAVARLRHPNVVQVHDVGDADGRPYFTMEYLEGGSLAQRLAGTPLPARQAAALLATLAGAVQAAHEQGVVHRDLKPANVLLTADGTPKVGDFGLARRLDGEATLTRTGAAVGTPSYMAPEQAAGKATAVGAAVDIHALGAILYELLTGRPPFRTETEAETLRQVVGQDPVPPSRLNARVPRDLETICLKCLHKEPCHRYATAGEAAQDLDRFLRGEAIAARPEGPVGRLARRVRRRPALSAALAAGTLFTVALVGGALWLISDRAAAAREVEAERAGTERAAADDLREIAGWLKKSAWPEARAALERARGRLGGGGPAELRHRLEQGSRDLELAARLEAIRLDSAQTGVFVGFVPAKPDDRYAEAFHRAGLGEVRDDPEVSADRVRRSDIRDALVAALDNWSGSVARTDDPRARHWALEVARRADQDPTGWRDRARDPNLRADQAALAEVIRTAPVADESVPLLLELSKKLSFGSKERLPFLKRVQQAHPGDFWANMTLGDVLELREKKPAEAVRYYQAAVSIRPRTGLGYFKLGSALSSMGRPEEAVEQFRQAVAVEPTSVFNQFWLADALVRLGRHDEAINHLQAAVRFIPNAVVLYLFLGAQLDARSRYADALARYQQAVLLDPNHKGAQSGLRATLVHLGRGEEARVAWQKALDANPPRHDDWYGYAEFCLFLGREDEYRRGRQALLSRFGTATDPSVAERTALACLLRPVSGDELRQAAALAGRAAAVEPSKYSGLYPRFLFARGLAEYRQGRLDRSIATMRGDAPYRLGPAPRLVLAMALHRTGQTAEARKTLAAAVLAHDWRASQARDQNDWICQVLRREAEAMILPNLPAFLDGKHQPEDNDERLALLGVCQFTNRSLALARLYADAFAADPHLAEDYRFGHRYRAARAAALVGCGRGEDTAGVGEPERAWWRRQARQWLRADLAARNQALDGTPAAGDRVGRSLADWLADPDLAGLRDPAELDKLPADDRKDCLALWDEVGVVFARGRVDR